MHWKMRFDRKDWITIVVAAVVILLLWVYAEFDPADSAIGRLFPKCPVKLLTGLQCPACGIQRAAHAILHADFIGALRQNWFLVFSLGYLAALPISKMMRQSHPTLYRFFWGRAGCTLYIVLYVAWFIVRNILGI